ncbi:hypothetical protein BC936DRAFT_144149 [Jimgerdemannia flammicorona]|uniref:Uncharacterized protein n=1 Tax=Jimgerdemannia flammicorona TaxID=994334 RepID=A0A432ZYE4_9FUNG|nr:hypothetical protein BC936DRAFT_144149 [Jimgerdemannia flammicorona]
MYICFSLVCVPYDRPPRTLNISSYPFHPLSTFCLFVSGRLRRSCILYAIPFYLLTSVRGRVKSSFAYLSHASRMHG